MTRQSPAHQHPAPFLIRKFTGTAGVKKLILGRHDPSQNGQNGGTLIGLDKAKSIAVQKAGLTLSEVTFTKAKLDYDSDGDKYEIEFFHGDYEYEVDVAAYSGTVLDYDVDSRWD